VPRLKKLSIPYTLTSRAYDSIKEYILGGRLDEDQRLTEESLASQLGISKSPIREALNRLESEGFIRIAARRGAFLRRFSLDEIQQLYDLREALEVHVARTAHLTPGLLDELDRSVTKLRSLRKVNDKTKYIEEDVRFHALLADATRNSELCRVLQNVQNRIWLSRRKTYDLSSSVAPDFHQAIVDALRKNNREEAQRVMRGHIAHVRQQLIAFLAHEKNGSPAAGQDLLSGERVH
jgi:DNA-binding GntR family transcriptional regulator